MFFRIASALLVALASGCATQTPIIAGDLPVDSGVWMEPHIVYEYRAPPGESSVMVGEFDFVEFGEMTLTLLGSDVDEVEIPELTIDWWRGSDYYSPTLEYKLPSSNGLFIECSTSIGTDAWTSEADLAGLERWDRSPEAEYFATPGLTLMNGVSTTMRSGCEQTGTAFGAMSFTQDLNTLALEAATGLPVVIANNNVDGNLHAEFAADIFYFSPYYDEFIEE